MPSLNLFIPITKVDAAQRLVYGTLASEVVDKTGEMFDYESSKPLVKEWSGEIEKATEGKSVGNLRFMHTKEVVGKFVQLECDDEKKSIEVCAKVSDDKRWAQVEEGEVSGFSIGGSYEKRWTDPDGIKRYTAKPSEGSLVDNPANPDCHFSMIKADGTTEMRKFHQVEPPPDLQQVWQAKDGKTFGKKADAEAHNAELAKAAGDGSALTAALDGLKSAVAKAEGAKAPVAKKEFSQEERDKAAESGEAMSDGSYPIQSKADLKNAIQSFGRAKNKKAVKAHIKARAKALGAEDELPESWKPSAEKSAVGWTAWLAKHVAVPHCTLEAAQYSAQLRKGLYSVARFAGLIEELEWLQQSCEFEAEMEGDESPVPDEIKKSIATLCACLRAMVEEETNELLDEEEMLEFGEMLEMSARAPMHKVLGEKAAKLLAKAGARHGKADATHLDAAHDHIKKAMGDDGKDCDKLLPGTEKSHTDNKAAHLVHAHNMTKAAGADCPGGDSKCAKYAAAKALDVAEDEGMSKADHLHAAHDHIAKMGIGACGKEAAAKLAKAGARHSAADLHALTEAHDSLKAAGADCPGGEAKCAKAEQEDDGPYPEAEGEPSKPGPSKEPKPSKAATVGDLQKLLADERTAHATAEKAMVDTLKELTAKVQKIADQPMPRPGEFHVGSTKFTVVEKSGTEGPALTEDDAMSAALAKMTPDERTKLLIRFARASATTVTPGR
jgi:hypothetical protein